MFNEGQVQHLVTHFRYLDKLLGDATADLTPSADGKLFELCIHDAAPEERQVLMTHVQELRAILRHFIQKHSLPDTLPPTSSLWAFQLAISYARVGVHELLPSYLGNYGRVDDSAAAAVTQLAVDLQKPLGRLEAYLKERSRTSE
jgi:hypothetical protein